MVSWALFAVLVAQHRPLPQGAPTQLVAPAARVHVVADEELDPDALRRLCRPRVTLWLKTRSNLLRSSTVENVARFDQAFVQWRSPVRPPAVQQLAKAPRAGLWLSLPELNPELQRARGSRPLALWFEGAIDESVADALRAAKPSAIEWRKPQTPDVLAWGLYRSLPGRKLVSVAPGQLLPGRCVPTAAVASDAGQGDGGQSPSVGWWWSPASRADEPALRAHLASLLALGEDPFPCGPGRRVVITPDTDRWLVQSVLVRDPSAELELQVLDGKQASKAATLLDDLGLERR